MELLTDKTIQSVESILKRGSGAKVAGRAADQVDEAAGLRTQYERTEAAGFGEKRGLTKSAGKHDLHRRS